jgi:hypothetical protein
MLGASCGVSCTPRRPGSIIGRFGLLDRSLGGACADPVESDDAASVAR